MQVVNLDERDAGAVVATAHDRRVVTGHPRAERRFPNNVDAKKTRPTKAWEIHPIKQVAER